MSSQFLEPILLIHRDGRTLCFADMQSAGCFTRSGCLDLGARHAIPLDSLGRPLPAVLGCEWIARDDRGQTVGWIDLVEAASAAVAGPGKHGSGRTRAAQAHAADAGLPIPYLRQGPRRRCAGALRTPRHRGVWRDMGCDGEGAPALRGKRAQLPPTLWDDLLRADRADRSWKRHRRTQYRPVVWARAGLDSGREHAR